MYIGMNSAKSSMFTRLRTDVRMNTPKSLTQHFVDHFVAHFVVSCASTLPSSLSSHTCYTLLRSMLHFEKLRNPCKHGLVTPCSHFDAPNCTGRGEKLFGSMLHFVVLV